MTHEVAKILIVEDEKPLAAMIAKYFATAGFQVRLAHTGVEALDVTTTFHPDVVLLDVGLPLLNGVEVCQQIRQQSSCYILMLTARGSENDKITGFAAGADDYITKPFSIRELIARVHAVLRRPRNQPEPATQKITYGDLTLELSTRQVIATNGIISLTPLEFSLIWILISNPQQVFSRRELITRVWGTTWVGDDRIVDVHIGNARRKIAAQSGTEIQTIRGVGYRMKPVAS